MLLDSQLGRHVLWQQYTGPYIAHLVYINDVDPARISLWQRMGFSAEDGGWSFLVALVESVVFAVITTVLNVWRLIVAWIITVAVLQVLRRLELVKSYIPFISWVLILLALLLAVRPETKTLGQPSILVDDPAHWAMAFIASLAALNLGRVWKEYDQNIFFWAGIAGLWLYVYYFLNLVLILRAGFAA
jgi:hypothetical protein